MAVSKTVVESLTNSQSCNKIISLVLQSLRNHRLYFFINFTVLTEFCLKTAYSNKMKKNYTDTFYNYQFIKIPFVTSLIHSFIPSLILADHSYAAPPVLLIETAMLEWQGSSLRAVLLKCTTFMNDWLKCVKKHKNMPNILNNKLTDNDFQAQRPLLYS